MPLEELKLDGSENGNSAGVKINLAIKEINRKPSQILAKSTSPRVILEVEDGGTSGAFQVYDMASPIHMVTGIQWRRDTGETDWTLSDKDTGVTKAMFQMKPDGTFHIGNGMVQHKIATAEDIANVPNYFDIQDANTADVNTLRTEGKYLVGSTSANKPPHTQRGIVEVSTDVLNGEMYQVFQSTDSFKTYERHSDGASSWDAWTEAKDSEALGYVTYTMTKKADKTSLPTVYSGEAEPLNTLGKDLDWYHRFEAGQSNVVDLYTGVSEENYSPWGFFLLIVDYGDVIEVYPSDRAIFIDTVNNSTLPAEDLTLTLDGNIIPLSIVSNTAGSMVAIYSQTWDAVIENVTVSSTFKITATEGIQTSREYDYQKHNGEWHRVDFLNVDEINSLIREYSTIVVYDLADSKKPTRAECIAICSSNHLPHFDWSLDDTFYIRDTGGGNKIVLVTYIADGATDEASAGNYFFKDMTECI